MFPSTSSRETLRFSGKQNSLFPSGADIKCIMYESIPNAIIPAPEFDFSNKYGQICDVEGETHCQIPNDAGEKHSQIPIYLPRTFPI